MRRIIIAVTAAIVLSSCGVSSPVLYYWGGSSNGTTRYEQLAYKHYDKQTPQSVCELICVYEDMVSHPGGARNVPPPGICAEYAYLISRPEVVEMFVEHATPSQKSVFKSADFRIYFPERAKELFEMEMALYPESAIFIMPLFERLTRN